MRRLLLVLLILLAGCSAQSRLAGRAADYYSYMAGHSSRAKYSSFLTPAYRKTMTKDDLKKYDAAIRAGVSDKSRYPKATARDIASRVEGRFAMTSANPELGDVYVNQRATKWVRVGQGWYVYLSSDAEVKAYGNFPVGMPPPVFSPAEK